MIDRDPRYRASTPEADPSVTYRASLKVAHARGTYSHSTDPLGGWRGEPPDRPSGTDPTHPPAGTSRSDSLATSRAEWAGDARPPPRVIGRRKRTFTAPGAVPAQSLRRAPMRGTHGMQSAVAGRRRAGPDRRHRPAAASAGHAGITALGGVLMSQASSREASRRGRGDRRRRRHAVRRRLAVGAVGRARRSSSWPSSSPTSTWTGSGSARSACARSSGSAWPSAPSPPSASAPCSSSSSTATS